MKLLLSLLSLFTLACISPRPIATSEENYRIPLDSPWNFCVFDIESDLGRGKAFIAGNEIITAKHIFFKETKVEDDEYVLSKSDYHGLDLCKIPVELHEILFYRTNEGIKYLLVAEVCDGYFEVVPLSQIKRGESGSPVMCLKHGDIVGIVSRLKEDPTGICVGGQITKIKLHTSD